MIREEFITAAGVCLERLLLSVRDLPEERFALPLADGNVSVHELFSDLAERAERTVRALELLYQGAEVHLDQLAMPAPSPQFKQTLSSFRIGHSTLLAALERIPMMRFASDGELPSWLLKYYLETLEQAVPRVENWAAALRQRGLGGPTGLPVIQ